MAFFIQLATWIEAEIRLKQASRRGLTRFPSRLKSNAFKDSGVVRQRWAIP
jgi:hypothetical protein